MNVSTSLGPHDGALSHWWHTVGLRGREGPMSRREALLLCGVAYTVLYPLVNDIAAASMHPGYSRMSQAVSELSATGAPSRPFLIAMMPLFSLLLSGFGFGIWLSARGRRSLRVAGALVVAQGVWSLLWIVAPMSQRDVLASGGGTPADTMHLVLSAATGLFVAAYVLATSIALGWVYRTYCALTILASFAFGMLSAQVDELTAGEPTPYMGILERTGIGAWLVWMAVTAVVLLARRPPDGKG